MYKVYSANRLEFLCQKLADNIKESDSGVFGKEIFITQSAGMKAWLKTELSRRNGVIANFDFNNQDGFYAEVYQLIFGERLSNNNEIIKYRLFKLLDIGEFRAGFPEVAGYYAGKDQRRIQLSAKIADLFDQYQLYRPAMIEGWMNGNLTTENPEEKWQLWLWKRLNLEPRFAARDRVIGKLNENKDKIKKSYPRISLFGITVFTDFHLEFFRELGKYTNVDFYLCLPTDHKETHNDLLESFGSKFKELTAMVEEKLGEFEYERQEYLGDTLLPGLQNGILNNTNYLVFSDDDFNSDKLLLHSCKGG